MKKSSNELLNVSNEDYKLNNGIDGGSKQAETTNDTIILDNVKSSQSNKREQIANTVIKKMSKGFNNKKYDYENELQFRQNLPPDPPYVVEGIEKISTMNTLLIVYQSEIISSSIIFLADMYAEILLTMKEIRHIFGQHLSNKGCIAKFQFWLLTKYPEVMLLGY